MDENIIEVRRFVTEATPTFWTAFHAWKNRQCPPMARRAEDHAPKLGTAFQRFNIARAA